MAVSLKSLRRVASYAVPALMLVLLAYGASRFHDGPISPCASGYCSTHGLAHSADDYAAYKAWEKTAFVIWPLGMVALFFLQRGKGDE
ncbi:hypothetical protein V4R08_05535 [Nitrobacter sp. NHB1]|uniref:hypothetical protein n=1 Tax=Nitrobacter sp. NHB1 TaxID=3119830 RepID=UPI002FFDB103